MLLGLESALTRPGADPEVAIRTALKRGEHLQDIIDDLLRLARDSRPRREVLDLSALLTDVRAQWQGPLTAAGRSLIIAGQERLPEVRAAPGAIRQILDVLIDNAMRHGQGRITVGAVDVGTGAAIEVGDEGPGVSDSDDLFIRRASASANGSGHGIGLALARSLAEAEGGRLVLRRPAPPVFTLLLPGGEP
jgi:signal transduction histidine kinase